jgi:hypothetical protein
MTRSGCPRRAAVAWARRHVRRSERYAVGNGKLTNAPRFPQRPGCVAKIVAARRGNGLGGRPGARDTDFRPGGGPATIFASQPAC